MREYPTEHGVMRVLRRPSQVNSPGHLDTLRRLPATDGHPASDADVSPLNQDSLVVGWTGDRLNVEELKGYPRPVGDTTVMNPETIAKIVDEETWAQYLDLFPDLGSVTRAAGPAQTGNSLGYNALWYGPFVEEEITGEHPEGGLVGTWQGPHGPEEYDVEHVIDPDCDLVQTLARESGFDPKMLGANHHATALRPLGGRGAQQSELMRIVDSLEVPITSDHARAASRIALQVPRRDVDAVPDWTVSTDRDLPIAEGDWDGDAAKASVFAWAGWPDKPDPAKARRAFLIHGADAPDLQGSYKLPIARYADQLEVVDEGLRAAASRLPQTDAPQEVLARAREVLDGYFEKLQAKQARTQDAMPTTQKITLGIGRDLAAKLSPLFAQRGVALPATITTTVDEASAADIVPAVESIVAIATELLTMLTEGADAAAEGEAAKEAEMADMMPKAEAEELVKLKASELAAAEEKLAAAADQVLIITADRDELLAEVAPIRAAALESLRVEAVALGGDEAKVKDAADAPAIKRVVVVGKLGDKYAKATDAAIDIAYDMAVTSAPAPETDEAKAAKAKAERDAKPGHVSQLGTLPKVELVKPRDESKDPPQVSTADALDAGAAALG